MYYLHFISFHLYTGLSAETIRPPPPAFDVAESQSRERARDEKPDKLTSVSELALAIMAPPTLACNPTGSQERVSAGRS